MHTNNTNYVDLCDVDLDEFICSECGKVIVNEDDVRSPDPDIYGEEKCIDYCLDCYVKLEYADLWEITYFTRLIELEKMILDVPFGSNMFQVRSWFLKQRPPLFWKISQIKKLNKKEKQHA